MSTDALKTILDGLNEEPFKKNFNLISFDTISSHQLLQILSDVILWIEDSASIDIREETPDETAIRLLNSLRILRFRPPTDIEELQEWRCGIVEGEKAVIYPILEWIFKNVDSLKERAYLAKFLTKIEVPGAFQDSEVAELSNSVEALMEEFKEVHSQVVEIRKDSLLAEDIRNDLKAMEQEKEQLNRKIERTERKLRGIPNIERYLHLASKCRAETERSEKIARLRIEQRNAIVFSEQKIQRLNTALKEVRAAGENIDPRERMMLLKEETETNRFVVGEKMPKEIAAKRAIVADLSKIADVTAFDKNDIAELQEKIETINREIMDLVAERDKKDENTDKLSIYRHQAAAVSRKKSILVEQLQEAKDELQNMENLVEAKKAELRDKGAGDIVISSIQFKNYVSKLRAKTHTYKRRRAEMDDLKSENAILARTADILSNQWNCLKQEIEESGGSVVLEFGQHERPKTAKPSTENTKQLREMVKELNDQIDTKKEMIHELTASNNRLSEQTLELSKQFDQKKRNYDTAAASLESEFIQLQQEVKEMEERIATNQWQTFRTETELKIINTTLQKMESEENSNEPKLIRLIEDEIERVSKEAESFQRQVQCIGDKLSTDEAIAQVAMWKSLVKIFQKKLQVAQTLQNGSHEHK